MAVYRNFRLISRILNMPHIIRLLRSLFRRSLNRNQISNGHRYPPLTLELMEDRLTPAHFVIQSETITGSGTAVATDGSDITDGPYSYNALTESPDGSGGNEWNGSCSASVIYAGSDSSVSFDDDLDPSDMGIFTPETSVGVYAQTGPGAFGYTPNASAMASLNVTVVLQIAPDAGETNGTLVTLNSLNDTGEEIDPGWSLTSTTDTLFNSSNEFGSAMVPIGSSVTFSDQTQFTNTTSSASQNLNSNADFQPDFTLTGTGVSLQVTTPDNADSGTQFGPYTAGVPLEIPFTVSGASNATSVKWNISGTGVASGTAKSIGNGNWTFQKEAQNLLVGTHTLTVTATNKTGGPTTYTGTITVVDTPLSLDDGIAASDNGGTLGTPIDVSDLRFISGIPLTEQFTGTITNLPYFYKDSGIMIPAFGKAVVNPVNVNGNLGFQVNENVGSLGTITQSLLPEIGGSPISHFGAQSVQFSVVAEPSWLKVPGKQPTFDFTSDAYEFTGIDSTVAKISVPSLKTGIGWLDDEVFDKHLTTSASLTPNLNVKITTALDGTPTITVNSLTANTIVLGTTIWQDTYTSDDVQATLTLDPQTLEPNDLKLLLTDTPEELASGTLFSKKVTVPIVTPLNPAVTITASLSLTLSGNLTVDGAGLEVSWANGQLAWVSSGTFIDLTATVTGSATANAEASVAGGWLGTYTASGTVTATLTITGQTEIGGTVLKPVLVDPTLTGTLSGSYEYSLNGTEKKGDKPVDEDDEPDGTFGPKTLFEL